ncbi:S-adenosylmethionine-binding protein [Candidatus Methylospira mobilis]|uniref:S-adenosylmethionine-binding protein n=1 Tax=Candidatus Methylospira mobilis TaxID=1808979 RepID=A0A5Q0BL30_9GAMM|nr:S-adenosylmethionine-binding protein [Candidatus Methylospira mobilis]QFY44645.1 S-adenosylmethionine-binding protein [Candidatus Methylospira mobilis]
MSVQKKYGLHPLCAIFPPMTGHEFEKLKIDIGANGQIQPIVLYENKILDGGNRYRVLTELGIEPSFVEYIGNSPVKYVLSCNLHRRHLTPGQAATIVAAAQDWRRAHPAHRVSKEGCNVAPFLEADNFDCNDDAKTDKSATLQFESVADRAADSGASLRTQKMADKLVKNAPPELVEQVTTGEKSLNQALKEIHVLSVNSKQKSQPPVIAGQPAVDQQNSEVESLRDQLSELAYSLEETLKENDILLKIIHADDQLAAAHAEVKRLNAMNLTLESRVFGLMEEKNEAIRLVKYYKREMEKGHAS